MSADGKFEKIMKELFDKFFENNPHFASYLGLHDPYDYLLPKGDTNQVLKNFRIFEESAKKMKLALDYGNLSKAHKIDYQVMERLVEIERFRFFEMRMHELNPDAFFEIGGILFEMITKNYAPIEKRIDAVNSRLRKLPRYLEEFQSRFENSRPIKLWTEIAFESLEKVPGLLQFIAASTKSKIPQKLCEELEKTIANLEGPIQRHMQWLEKLKLKTTENWSLGKGKFEKLIQLRGLELTSEEILRLGQKYFNELKLEREQITEKISPGNSAEEAMNIIERNAPGTFEEALSVTSKVMEDAKQFIIDNDIAKISKEDKLLIKETPAFLAPLIPFAAMSMPSRFDEPMIGIYYVTRPKDIKNLGNHLNYASIKNTAVHEAFPGHFLQGTISNRSSLIRMFAPHTETTEGWAHYCEQMMVEKGFVKSLESKLVQVNDGIWRAVRIILDVKLSRGEINFDEAVNMLIKETGMSREGATTEVRRYTQTPGYALSYLLGKHLILQLRKEVKQELGNKYSDKFFHNVILENGYLPVSLLRKVFKQRIIKLKS